MKVGSKNRRLEVGLIKALVNAPNFELALMVRAFVESNMLETFLSVIGHF